MIENSNVFTKTNSKNWIKLVSNLNQLWKLRPSIWHYISGISFIIHQEKETSATNETKPHYKFKRETIQSPKHEQLRTTKKIVEQGKVVKNGRKKYQRKPKLFF